MHFKVLKLEKWGYSGLGSLEEGSKIRSNVWLVKRVDRCCSAPVFGGGSSHHMANALSPLSKPCRGAVCTQSVPTTSSFAEELNRIDSGLQGFGDHFAYRQQRYEEVKGSIVKNEGSLEDFALGYKRFGVLKGQGCITYTEWVPDAESVALIGDFNEWKETPLELGEFGVWSIKLPDKNGKPAIAHGSRLKVRLKLHNGDVVDRLPAWIHYATKPDGAMDAGYNGVFWSPPRSERHNWRHKHPRLEGALKIYEAHVGLSSEDAVVATYTYFRENVLHRIAGLGYNAIQLMAVQEHAYYASFGYHVTNPFAVSSRSGTPEELKALVDAAHGMGLIVLLDVVHSHISSNANDGLAGFDTGNGKSYFAAGERGYHSLWDSKLFEYSTWETMRYLLSNLRWWLEEYRFDGFRFDGVTSMLYQHHGIHRGFSGDYNEYFGHDTNVDAVVYLMLANEVVHSLRPRAVTIAEDVSGMPGLGLSVSKGGVGFDYRLGMGLPDYWANLIKDTKDENWNMSRMIYQLCDRRYSEKTIAYVESHDQCLVGDQTLGWRLMGKEMYDGMSALGTPGPIIDRGCALHKMIRLVTMAIGGDGWLNFMGNEFGHPEWLDFPREGNDWSHHYCRRQWSLVDNETLRYRHLNSWEGDALKLDRAYGFMSSPHQMVTFMDEENKVIVAERGPLVFVFNFSPTENLEAFKIGVPDGGRYEVVLSSDSSQYGGSSRIGTGIEHFSQPEGIPGQPATNFNNRPHSIMIASPSRTAAVYSLMPEF